MSALNQLQEAEAELRELLRQPTGDGTGENEILTQITEMSNAWNTQQLDALLSLSGAGNDAGSIETAGRLAERATLAASRVQKQIAKAAA